MSGVDLQGRHALVTGGGTGIGKAIAARLAKAGATVSLVGRTAETLGAAHQELGLTGGTATADVADVGQVESAVAHLREAHGPIAIIVNNAGIAESAPFRAVDSDLWQRAIAVNLTGTFNVTQAVLADITASTPGRIVNIASTAALKGYAYVAAYCAAKHGVLGLTRALALELARKDVTVNAVCPGYTESDMLERSVEKITATAGMSDDEARAALVQSNPQGRFILGGEVADAVLWLCGDNARSVTGQAIAVAGGEVM